MRVRGCVLSLMMLLVLAPTLCAQSVLFKQPLAEGLSATYRVESEESYDLKAAFLPGGGDAEEWSYALTLGLDVERADDDGATLIVTVRAIEASGVSRLLGEMGFSGRAGEGVDLEGLSMEDERLARALAPSLGKSFRVTLDAERQITTVLGPRDVQHEPGAVESSLYRRVLGVERLREALQPVLRPLGAPRRVQAGDEWSHSYNQRTSLAALRFTSTHRVESIDDARALFVMDGEIDIDAQGMGRNLKVDREVYRGSIAWDLEARLGIEARSEWNLAFSLNENPKMSAEITGSRRVVRLDDAPGSVDDLSELLEKACARFDQPAIAAAVVSSQEILALGVAGTRVTGVSLPAEPDDRWHLGSCTKAMTAALLMHALQQQDVLTLDSTLSQVFPELADRMHERYAGATLRDVVGHTGGFPSMTNGAAPDRAAKENLPDDPREARAAFAERLLTATDDDPYAPITPPGGYAYSNAGFGVAAAVTERLLDEPWEDLMRAHVFGPLGMDEAGFGWPASIDPARQPRGHIGALGALEAQPIDASYELEPCIDPAGDVHASIGAWARFAQDRLRALRGEDSPLLGPEATRDLVDTQETRTYAGGWGVGAMGETTIYGHDGSAGTFYCTVWIVPGEDRAYLVVTNAGTGAEACEGVRGRLVERYGGE